MPCAALRALGVQVQQFAQNASAQGDEFRGAVSAAEGAPLRLVDALIDLPAGSYYVPLTQPLANLVIAALEPNGPASYLAHGVIADASRVARVRVPPEGSLTAAPLKAPTRTAIRIAVPSRARTVLSAAAPPPRMPPSTPRMISRPTLEPIVRTAERAAASARPSCLPPRGPVEPNSTSFRPPSMPPPAPPPAPAPPRCRRSCRRRGRSAAAPPRRARRGAALQLLVGRFAVDRLLVDAGHQRAGDQRLALRRRDRADLAARRDARRRARSRSGRPFASSRLTSASPTASSVIAVSMSSPGLARIVLAAAFTAFWSRGVKARSACCTRLPSWASTRVGDVERVLRHEVDADALAAHQPHHQLDALDQHLGRLVEQQVRLVEEEHQLRLVEVADLGQLLEQLGQHPQQEGRVQARRVQQLVGGEDVDDALAVASVCMKSAMLSIGSPKNLSPPCSSICSRPRWIAPMLAALMLPYSVGELRWRCRRRAAASRAGPSGRAAAGRCRRRS